MYANVYSKANSANATKFLRELIENAPYKVRSIQVDGDLEFMKDSGDTCKEFGIPRFVLPPEKPTYNGKIERSNRVFREEFYEELSENSIVGVRRELMQFLQKCNFYHLPARFICTEQPHWSIFLSITPETIFVLHLSELEHFQIIS